MNLVEYPDRDLLAIDVANRLAGDLENGLLRHPTVSFAVPGGTSPGPIFDALCAANLDWSRVHVIPTDERWVPQDHPRSNARLILERLIKDRATQARFIPLFAPATDPETVLAEITAQIAPELPLNVVLLGMGADMHTASLFSGAPGLEATLLSDAPILVVQQPPTQEETRVSLSARVLNGGLSKHLVIMGQDKRDALDKARSLPPEQAPINAVLDGITVHWAP